MVPIDGVLAVWLGSLGDPDTELQNYRIKELKN